MKYAIAGLVLFLALILVPYQGHALSITVGTATVNVGDIFTINLEVAGAVNLTSWQFDLNYNPLLFQANSVTEGSFLSSAGSTLFVPGFIDNTAGLIGGMSGFFTDLFPPSGSGVLAIIEFTAVGSGLSPLTLANGFVDGGLTTGFTVGNNSGCVLGSPACSGSPVPEPSSVALLLLGGFTLWGVRRWQTSGAETR